MDPGNQRTAIKRKRIVWLIIGLVLLGGVASLLATPLIKRGAAWCEMRRHFQNCRTLQAIITKYYVDHQADNPLPVASFTALKNGGYIDDAFIKYLTRDEGVYCFYSPPSSDPTDPIIGYFSKKHVVIFTVNGQGSVFQDEEETPAPPR